MKRQNKKLLAALFTGMMVFAIASPGAAETGTDVPNNSILREFIGGSIFRV